MGTFVAPETVANNDTGTVNPDRSESLPQGKGKQEAIKQGPLLDEPNEEKAFKRAERLWNQDKKRHHRNAAKWKQNKWWRDGRRFVKIIEEPDSDEIRLSVPLGMEGTPPVPNDCDSKIRDLVSRMLADPPKPECEPWDDTAKARSAAQFATRVLTIESSEAGMNTDNVFAEAMDIAGTYASSFVYVCYDPKGGGLQPEEISCHPDAQNEAEAAKGPEGSLPKPAIRKFLMPDGTLSSSSKGSNKVWVPKIKLHKFTGNHVRFLPRNCSGMDDADGVIFAYWTNLGDLKSRFPRVAQMSPKELHELANWRLPESKRLLPEGMEETPSKTSDSDPKDAPDDDAMCLTLNVYYKSTPLYPYGAYVTFGGGKYRLHKQTWNGMTPDANGQQQDELLDLPFAQCRWLTDAQGGNPYGKAPAEKLGLMDEMRATIYASALEYLYRFGRPRPYLPMGTTVQPEDLADPEKPIYYNPNGKPEWQPTPDFPQMGMEMIDRLDVEMDREVSVFDPGRGMASGSIRSADQQQQVIEQGNAGTSFFRANMVDFYERLHRIILQQMRAWFKDAQMMRYQGDGGSFQVEEWKNTDLGSTREVKIAKGSFTLLAPTQKTNLIGMQMQMAMITPLEAQRLMRDNVSPLIGLQENPHIERIKRQLFMWRKGPSEEQKLLPPPEPQLDEMGQPAVDPQTGQPLPPIDPLAQAAEAIFTLLPVDDEPDVAIVRHQELSRAVSEMETQGHPPGWQNGLVNVYMRTRQAAGIVTIPEQQQAMQQQQEQANQASQAEAEGKMKLKEQELNFKKEENALDLENKKQQSAQDMELQGQKHEMQQEVQMAQMQQKMQQAQMAPQRPMGPR